MIAKNTPAITIVGLCDGDGIGVGAGVTFNDHVANGNWANFKYKIENKLKGIN